MTRDGWPDPPPGLVESQRRNLARATPAILHLARRLQITAQDWKGPDYGGLGYVPELDDPSGGPFAPAPLYLEMAISLSEKPELTTELLLAIQGIIPK